MPGSEVSSTNAESSEKSDDDDFVFPQNTGSLLSAINGVPFFWIDALIDKDSAVPLPCFIFLITNDDTFPHSFRAPFFSWGCPWCHLGLEGFVSVNVSAFD